VDQRAVEAETTVALRQAGARFAFVHGSRAGDGRARAGSDLDVAAWWGRELTEPWGVVVVPDEVDLLVLDGSPLELAGRVATAGRLLFDDDPPARVRWQALTRKMYLDEQSRQERLHRVFVTARLGGERHGR
jgi:predicted nucleotidyltransferase